MATKTYGGNVYAQTNTVNIHNGSQDFRVSFILVRLAQASDQTKIFLPFSRVTTWERLIATLHGIYVRNNPNTDLGIEDLQDAITVFYDNGDLPNHHPHQFNYNAPGLPVILEEFWNEALQPSMQIAVAFKPPFLRPPWNCNGNCSRSDDEDTEMSEVYSLECSSTISFEASKFLPSKKAASGLLPPSFCKTEDPLNQLPTHLSATAASSIGFPTGYGLGPLGWGFMDTEKSDIRAHTNGHSALPEVLTGSVYFPRHLPPYEEAISSGRTTIPTFRDPFGSSNGGGHMNGMAGTHPTTTAPPQSSFLPTHLPGSPKTPQRPHVSDDNRSSGGKDRKRKRDEDYRMSSGTSRSASPSSKSNGRISRGVSMESEANGNGNGRTIATPKSKLHTEDSPKPDSGLIVRGVMLLDTLSAGETIKVVKVKDGTLVAIRETDTVEGCIERRQSNAAMLASESGKSRQSEPRDSKRRRQEEPNDLLLKIWTGQVAETETPKVAKHEFKKLTHEHKAKINVFVREHHIIRNDHFTAPVIDAWRAKHMADADRQETNTYIDDIAPTVYKTSAERASAFKLFMEKYYRNGTRSQTPQSTSSKQMA